MYIYIYIHQRVDIYIIYIISEHNQMHRTMETDLSH